MLSKKTILLVTLTALAASSFAESTLRADEVMKKSDERYTGDTRKSESVLTLIDKQDRRRTRELKSFGVDAADVDKSIIFFLSPSDVKGTAYLSYDWESEAKEDDSWLYLPALQKVKRVAASDESGAFMGSDFSYADINGLDYEDFIYSMEKASEIVSGKDCWVIKSLPKNKEVINATGYTGLTSWVRKDNYMVVKSIIELKRGKKVKYFSASDIEQVDGVWTAKTLQMVTTKRGSKEHASVLKVMQIKYNDDIEEALFDTQAMQRGL